MQFHSLLKFALSGKELKQLRNYAKILAKYWKLPKHPVIRIGKESFIYETPRTYQIRLRPDLFEYVYPTLLHEMGHAYIRAKHPLLYRTLARYQYKIRRSKLPEALKTLLLTPDVLEEIYATHKGYQAGRKLFKFRPTLERRLFDLLAWMSHWG